MPSPIGHGLAGLVCATIERARRHQAGARPTPARTTTATWLWTCGMVIAANGPDFDFIPGFLLGAPDLFHRGNLHSLGAAVLFGLIVYLIGRLVRRASALRAGVFVGVAYASHVLLDLLATGGQQWGVPLFWPLSEAYFKLPFALFFPIAREETVGMFFPSLIQPHNLLVVLWEIVVMGSVLLATRRTVARSRTGARAGQAPFQVEAQDDAR